MYIDLIDPKLPLPEEFLIQILWAGGMSPKEPEPLDINQSFLVASSYIILTQVAPYFLGLRPFS